MNYRFVAFASFTMVLLLTASIGGQNLSAYAASSNPPSFGGGTFLKYSDGLVINGEAIDASKYSQKMTTPKTLTVGESSTITLKIFDNHGPSTIQVAALYMDMKGTYLSTSTGDTSIVYFVDKQQVSITDPHKFLGKVTVDYKIQSPFLYVTFHLTPISKMDKSNLSIAAMDDHKSFVSSLLINAIQFS